jgi:DNA-directed RNA polymerase sigma subunit (sigma70/sigma32)
MKSPTVIREGKQLPVDGSVDAGLLMLSLCTPRGQTRSLREIAFVCGVKMQNIHYIEKVAIRKIRQEFTKRGIY